MPHKLTQTAMPVMLLPLALLLAGCASPLPASRQVAPPQVPPLPQIARQPKIGPECSPTCSAALLIELQAWQRSLTSAAPQESPASGPMMR